jgi:hypothetical protein
MRERLLRPGLTAETGRGGWTRGMRHPVTFEINEGIPGFGSEAHFFARNSSPPCVQGFI